MKKQKGHKAHVTGNATQDDDFLKNVLPHTSLKLSLYFIQNLKTYKVTAFKRAIKVHP